MTDARTMRLGEEMKKDFLNAAEEYYINRKLTDRFAEIPDAILGQICEEHRSIEVPEPELYRSIMGLEYDDYWSTQYVREIEYWMRLAIECYEKIKECRE